MNPLRRASCTAVSALIPMILFGWEASHAFSESRVSSLIRTTSKRSLQEAVETTSKMRKAKAGCETELSLKAIPVSCFEQLHFEIASGRLSSIHGEKQRERLTRICTERVKTVTSWEHLKDVVRSADVSELCRFKSRERLEDLYYQAETDAPSRLFEEYGPDFD